MATWASRGLRGSTLEELINRSNDKYKENHLALIQKIPTPITPVQMSRETRQITLAYFEQKSTVDYIGIVQGIPVCFDAKECHTDRFPLQNIHEHQIAFMKQFEEQDGIAFFIIQYTREDEIYYVPFATVMKFWDRMLSGGRKSFTKEEIDTRYRVRSHNGILVHYLEQLQMDLDAR